MITELDILNLLDLSLNRHFYFSLAYARYLFDCGNREAAFYFCERADEKGEILQRELELMTSQQQAVTPLE
jgi:hypothetical protein